MTTVNDVTNLHNGAGTRCGMRSRAVGALHTSLEDWNRRAFRLTEIWVQ